MYRKSGLAFEYAICVVLRCWVGEAHSTRPSLFSDIHCNAGIVTVIDCSIKVLFLSISIIFNLVLTLVASYMII